MLVEEALDESSDSDEEMEITRPGREISATLPDIQCLFAVLA
jgi:hypothetical protein